MADHLSPLPLPPDPREQGDDYRENASLGEKNKGASLGDDAGKPKRELSFERETRVREFEKDHGSTRFASRSETIRPNRRH